MFFAESDNKRENTSLVPSRLKSRSTFDPPIINNMLETFQELVTQEVTTKWDKFNIKHHVQKNITHQEICAIKDIEEDTTITLKKPIKAVLLSSWIPQCI